MFKPFVLFVCAVGLLVARPVAAVAEETPSLPQVAGAEKQIQEALDKPASLELIDTPLSEVVNFLEEGNGIEIRIDSRALEDLGVSTDEPVTINLKGISLQSALRLMLRDLELTYVIKDEVLLITTVDEADNTLTTRVYPVRDLAKSEPWHGGAIDAGQKEGANFDSLIKSITYTVHYASWDEAGGPGSIQKIAPDQLVIAQTEEVHEQVNDLLVALRKIPQFSEQEPGKVYQPVRSGVHESAEEKIGKALDRPTELQFIETPLGEVVKLIVSAHGINIQLDDPALEDLGISTDEPITIELRDITLRSALELMLRDLELTSVIRDEVLMITTVDEADNELSTVVYPVGDIIDREYADDGEVLKLDMNSLRKTISSTVDVETWDEAGGPGSIVEFAQRGVFVVSQTQKVHDQISSLLNNIRAARKITGYQPTAEKPDPAEVVVRTYWYRDDAMSAKDDIVPHVEYVLDVNEKAGQYVAYLPNRIVVRQRRDAQAKLRRLLIDELKVCSAQPPKNNDEKGGGFGGGGVFSPVRVDR